MKKTAALATLLATLGLFAFTHVHAGDAADAKPAHKMKGDANQDGKISYDEYRAANEKRVERQFKRMDANGDGSIDQAEKQAVSDKMRARREKRRETPTTLEAPASN